MGSEMCIRDRLLTQAFDEFLVEEMSKHDTAPRNVKEWELSWHCRLVLTNKDNLDNIGFVPWRIAFYVSGGSPALKDFLMFFSAFCHWRTTNRNGEKIRNLLS